MPARTVPIRWTKGRLARIDCGVSVLDSFSGPETEEESSPAARSGSAFHRAAELLFARVATGSAIDRAIADARAGGEPVLGDDEAKLRAMWRSFLLRVVVQSEGDLLGIELAFALDSTLTPIDGADEVLRDRSVEGRRASVEVLDVLFAGIWDLVHYEGSRLVITDWKSGYRIQTEKEIEEDAGTVLYAAAAAEVFDYRGGEIVVRHVFPRYEGRSRLAARWGGVVREVVLDAQDAADRLADWREVVRGREALPLDDPYWTEPRAVPTCGYCRLREGCAVYDGDDGSPGAVVELGRKKRGAEKLLRARAKDGAVEVDGVVAHYVSSDSTIFDVALTIAFLDGKGVDPLSVLSIDGRLAKKVIGAGWTQELRDLGALDYKTRTRFVVEVAKAGEDIG